MKTQVLNRSVSPTNIYVVEFLHWILSWILWLVWEPFSLKRSHWWHWSRYRDDVPKSMTIAVGGDQKVRPCVNAWCTFWQTNFGWKDAIVIRPRDETTSYRIGFRSLATTEICSITIPSGASVALLIGHWPMEIFAVDSHNILLRLNNVGRFHKKHLPRGVRLL